jgi:hypothetical protein
MWAEGSQAGVELLTGGERERGAWFSPRYGTRTPSRALRISRELTERCSLTTCLSTSDKILPVVTPQQGGLAIRVMRGEGWEESLSYLTDGLRTPQSDGVHFDGTLLFYRRVSGRRPVVYANHFRELSLDGLLDVRAPTTIDNLVLDDDHCEVVLDADYASRLHVKLPHGVRLVINGRADVTRAAHVPSPIAVTL